MLVQLTDSLVARVVKVHFNILQFLRRLSVPLSPVPLRVTCGRNDFNNTLLPGILCYIAVFSRNSHFKNYFSQ